MMPNCPIPKLLPYNKLVKEINQVSIGNVYKHEFVMLVWLPEQGFNLSTYKHTAVYIPDRVFADPRVCYCNLEKASPTDGKCTFCGDPVMKFIQQSVEQGKVLPQLLGDTRA